MTSPLGKIRGHVGEAKGRAAADAAARKAAEQAPRSTILGKNAVQGEYDVHRVLTTTLGGKGARAITHDDLATFRRNMKLAQKNFKGDGITARQVIDLASSRALNYAPNADGSSNGSDLDKARKEITSAVAVSALVTPDHRLDVRFMTNAGKDSDAARHHVLVRFNAFQEAANKLMSRTSKDAQSPKQVAGWLRKQKLAFDCDCGRHRYFLRYVATIGNFNAGRPEHGFPKIRNPELKGVACKHVLRVMAEIDASPAVGSFLAKHLEKVLRSADNTARHQQKQADADAQAKKQSEKPIEIKTTEQKKAERQLAKEVHAAKSAAQNAPRAKKTGAASRKIESAINSGQMSALELATLRKFGMSDAKIAALLKK